MATEEKSAACERCPLVHTRREFLLDVGLSAVAALAALALIPPSRSMAASVVEVLPVPGNAGSPLQRSYALPATDGISVDAGSDVIIARWEGRVYAFSLRCPHRGARLEWRPSEQRIYCPKHEARFLTDGSHASGRGTRALDRYGVRRQGTEIVVDVSRPLREDSDPAWVDAVILAG